MYLYQDNYGIINFIAVFFGRVIILNINRIIYLIDAELEIKKALKKDSQRLTKEKKNILRE